MSSWYQKEFSIRIMYHLFYFSMLQVISPPFTKTPVSIK
ncbi:hypothetical protein ECAA86_01654 [Escherichia coli AA86]|nr:hypothetical protein ECAA86_01654 [Escherichia coli AA86]